MMAALALFGNNTFFHTAANTTEGDFVENTQAAKRICQSGRIPFSVYRQSYDIGQDIMSQCSEYTLQRWEYNEDYEDGDDLLSYLVGGFMQSMQTPELAKEVLEISMFFANKALLSGTAEMGAVWESRWIYSAPGYQVLKPRKNMAGVIGISILILFQILGLLLLLRFIYRVPAWTGSFDADSLVQIGGQLREQDQKLNIAGASGLVGIVDRAVVPSTAHDEDTSDEGDRPSDQGCLVEEEDSKNSGSQFTVPLALGGPGIITKRLHKQT